MLSLKLNYNFPQIIGLVSYSALCTSSETLSIRFTLAEDDATSIMRWIP